jgi:hypothetical protein
MPSILDLLSTELRGKLTFYHKGVTNLTHPGAGFPHRVGDKIRFEIFAKNTSNQVSMRAVSGWIKHAAATSFTSVSFSVPALTPSQEVSLAKIDADVVANTNDAGLFDKVAIVDATASGDLSRVSFVDTGFLVDKILDA